MALVPVTNPVLAGLVLTATAATAGPDEVHAGGTLLVHNTGGVATVLTIVVPGNTQFGQPQPDITSVSIPAASLAAFDIRNTKLQDSTGTVKIDANPSAGVNFYNLRS